MDLRLAASTNIPRKSVSHSYSLRDQLCFPTNCPFNSSGFLWENIYFDQCYTKVCPPAFWQKENGSLTSVLVLLTSSNWRPPPLEHSHFTSQQTVHQSIQFYFDENCLNIIICLCYSTTTLITQLCSIKIAHSFHSHRWVNPCLVDWEIVWGVLGRALGFGGLWEGRALRTWSRR